MHGLHINNHHILYTLTGSLLLLTSGFLVLSFLCPFATDNSYATTETTQNGDYYIETTTTDLNLSINTTPAGAQETASHDVIVKTDDPAGYTLSVSVNNDTSNALNLNGNTSATSSFPATSGTYTNPTALDENSWGFTDTLTKKDNDQWSAVPLLSNSQQIKQTNSANTSGDTTTVYYAINAKYDGKHENGGYSNTIIYSVTGNTIPDYSLNTAIYMQDADIATKCANSTETTSKDDPHNYELIDLRNNEPYYIRKFSTGSGDYCIMVENLYLRGGTELTDSNSNVSSSYTLPSSTTSGYYTSNTTPQMYNGGRYRNDYYQTINSKKYPTDGSYYSWCAATAGTGGCYNSNKEAGMYDICPKNWHIPSKDEYDNLQVYLNRNASNWLRYALFAQSDGSIKSEIYSGHYENSSLRGAWLGYSMAGTSVSWWTNTQTTSSYAYYWGLSSGTTSPNKVSHIDKYFGRSVRCLVQATS